MSLFNNSELDHQRGPLAYRARPSNREEFIGQEAVFRRYPFLLSSILPSLILFGPPGCGKTTLAYLLATESKKEIYTFNAVLSGVPELRKLIDGVLESKQLYHKEAIIFIDEIHRFNKAQQDALLPHVEKGSFTLIGATTENPRRSINRALLSRVQIVELVQLEEKDILKIIQNAAHRFNLTLHSDTQKLLSTLSGGDARNALNFTEIIAQEEERRGNPLEFSEVKELIKESIRYYDKAGDRHYDAISAFIKSLRGSDPDAAIYYLAIMLDGGEDPSFIARRLMIFASEDVGNADPSALTLAVAGLQAVEKLGMPEARINLAQVTTYLASTVKSNAAYNAINEALEYVKNETQPEVPNHLKNYPPAETKQYLYPHNYPHHFVEQRYTDKEIPHFYKPTEMGREKNILERLKTLWKNRY